MSKKKKQKKNGKKEALENIILAATNLDLINKAIELINKLLN